MGLVRCTNPDRAKVGGKVLWNNVEWTIMRIKNSQDVPGHTYIVVSRPGTREIRKCSCSLKEANGFYLLLEDLTAS